MYDWQVKEQYTIVFSIVSTNSLKHKYTSKASIPVQSFYLFKSFFIPSLTMLLQIIWRPCRPIHSCDSRIYYLLLRNPEPYEADRVHQDPKIRVSGRVCKSTTVITAFHLYNNDSIVFTRKKYNLSLERFLSDIRD
ncbi:Uncharacterized protein HZ326_11087 [Fusarium oxysporum f. sp. albedinis]|nr:Uncharacterized protein HZ326_11087 [Fusarium oxysporum f. sp. albedinis]